MEPNFLISFGAALIPLVIGAVWYNPKIGLGTAWMNSTGLTEEKLQGANMPLIFGLTYVLSLLAAFGLVGVVVHQVNVFSLFVTEPGFEEKTGEAYQQFESLMSGPIGSKHRTFGHGAFHGGLTGFLLATPIIGIIALFERKGWKYIAIHAGYWIVSFLLMGGVICAFL